VVAINGAAAFVISGSFLTKLSNTIETAPCFRVPLVWGIACGLAAGLRKFRIHRASPRTFWLGEGVREGMWAGGKEASNKLTQDSQSCHVVVPLSPSSSTHADPPLHRQRRREPPARDAARPDPPAALPAQEGRRCLAPCGTQAPPRPSGP